MMLSEIITLLPPDITRRHERGDVVIQHTA